MKKYKKIIILLLILISIASLFLINLQQNIEEIPQVKRDSNQTQFGLWVFFSNNLDQDTFIRQFGMEFRRNEVHWEWVEKVPGKYDWSQTDKFITKSKENNLKLAPVLKIGQFWATGHKEKEGPWISSPPLDLKETWNQDYAYSKGYYDFVYKFVDRYKNDIEYLTIENEISANIFWDGSLEDYLKLLETAYKAAHDASPKIKVTDSGFPSEIWGNQIAYDKYTKGEWNSEETLGWLKSYYKYSKQIEILNKLNLEDLEFYTNDSVYTERREYIQKALENFPGKVDVVNFHFYEGYEHFPDVIDYLRKVFDEHGWKNPPIITNELGNKMQGPYLQQIDRDAKEHANNLVKKMTISMAKKLEFVTWFSVNEKGIFGSYGFLGITDNNGKFYRSAYALRTFMKILKDYNFESDLSNETVWRFKFKHRINPSKFLDIVWSENEQNLGELPIPKKVTTLYDKEFIYNKGDNILINSEPLFIEYEIPNNL